MSDDQEVIDDEYEYQYDENENEVFLVDLDLSTLHGVTKSSNSRRTLGKSKQKRTNANKGPVNPPNRDGSESDEPTAPPSSTLSKVNEHSGIMPDKFSRGVQILDIDTDEPIISYNDQTYACSWIDMVGTNMFFGPAEEVPPKTVQPSAKYGALLGTSRVKLLGNRVTLSKATPKKRGRRDGVENAGVPDEQEPSSPKTVDPQANAEMQRQTQFLERLRDAKRRRRQETHLVTGTGDASTPSSEAQLDDQAPAVAQENEVNDVNLRIDTLNGEIDTLSQPNVLDPT